VHRLSHFFGGANGWANRTLCVETGWWTIDFAALVRHERLARLAIHDSSTVALFLIETWGVEVQACSPTNESPLKGGPLTGLIALPIQGQDDVGRCVWASRLTI
jgi:hypothetical protein